MSLSTLPDLCLLNILDRIPLRHLLTKVNRVCHRWANLYPTACARWSHSLILVKDRNKLNRLLSRISAPINDTVLKEVANDDGTSYYCPNRNYQQKYHTLMITYFSSQLWKLLPNITSLQIGQTIFSWSTQIDQINRLLHAWSDSLVHLNLYLYDNSAQWERHSTDYDPQLIDSLFDQINQLFHLKRLKMQFGVPTSHKGKHNLSTKLSILPQLEQFAYRDLDQRIAFDQFVVDNIEDALESNENCSLKQIYLDPYVYTRARPFSPELFSKLTDYRMSIQGNFDDFCFKLSHFDSVQILSISLNSDLNISFARFINHLSHLSQLTLLRCGKLCESFLKPALTGTMFMPMPSIKALDFYFETTLPHSQFEHLFLAQTFPNVQVIRLAQFSNKCTECRYNLSGYRPADKPKVESCTRKILEPLKMCSKLRKIYFQKTLNNLRNFDDDVDRSLEFVFTPEQL